MKGRLFGLLAALGAMLSDSGPATGSPLAGRSRRATSASELQVQRAHQRAADRKATREQLERMEVLGIRLSPEQQADLRSLRLTRGKLARRMRRGREKSINVRLRAAAQRRGRR